MSRPLFPLNDHNSPEGRREIRERYRVKLGQELTYREREVIAQVLRGVSNAEIGRTLGLQEKTIKFHLSRIYRKLGIANRSQLILQECKRG